MNRRSLRSCLAKPGEIASGVAHRVFGPGIEGLSPGMSRNRKLGFANGPGRFNRMDVGKSASHELSQNEMTSDNPCSRHLSGNRRKMRAKWLIPRRFSAA